MNIVLQNTNKANLWDKSSSSGAKELVQAREDVYKASCNEVNLERAAHVKPFEHSEISVWYSFESFPVSREYTHNTGETGNAMSREIVIDLGSGYQNNLSPEGLAELKSLLIETGNIWVRQLLGDLSTPKIVTIKDKREEFSVKIAA